MKVYVVVDNTDWESDENLGVFATHEKARQFVADHCNGFDVDAPNSVHGKNHSYDPALIEEWEVV
jgi:hypothetical protein